MDEARKFYLFVKDEIVYKYILEKSNDSFVTSEAEEKNIQKWLAIAFEEFYSISPNLDYSKLEKDEKFVQTVVIKIRKEIRKEIFRKKNKKEISLEELIENNEKKIRREREVSQDGFDSDSYLSEANALEETGEIEEFDEETGQFKKIKLSGATEQHNSQLDITTPFDIEGEENHLATIRLVNHFFNLPLLEKESYILRIKNKALISDLKDLEHKRSELIKSKDIMEDVKAIKISQLEKEITEIEREITKNEESNLSHYFSSMGIKSLQRRAAIRIKMQWKKISEDIGHELKRNYDKYY